MSSYYVAFNFSVISLKKTFKTTAQVSCEATQRK